MIYTYKNFDKIELPNGIILVSKCHNDFPFVIMNNSNYGFKVILSDEVGNFGYNDRLDMFNMATYMKDDTSNWVVCIPYKQNAIHPSDYFGKEPFSIYNQFDNSKIPYLPHYLNCAVVTGFCE